MRKSRDSSMVAYVPALHQGYLNLFQQFPDTPLYIMGKQFIELEPRLDRDLRAVDPTKMALALRAIDVCERVEVLTSDNLTEVQGSSAVIMPDEDITRKFSDEYLNSQQARFVHAFLRWDKSQIKFSKDVSSYDFLTSDVEHIAQMSRVLNEAELSPDWWRQVGAMAVTQDGTELLAHNTPLPNADYSLNTFGDPRTNFQAGENIDMSKFIHAEAGVVAHAAREGISLRDSSIYVSTFPCPPCAKLIASAGISQVFFKDGYSILDAEDVLRAANITIGKVLMPEATRVEQAPVQSP